MGCPKPLWAFAAKHVLYPQYDGPEGAAEDYFTGILGCEGGKTIQIDCSRMSHSDSGRCCRTLRHHWRNHKRGYLTIQRRRIYPREPLMNRLTLITVNFLKRFTSSTMSLTISLWRSRVRLHPMSLHRTLMCLCRSWMHFTTVRGVGRKFISPHRRF